MRLKSFAARRHIVLLVFFIYAAFLAGRSKEKRAQLVNSTYISSTFGHDAKTLDLQWVKNLTNLKHQRTKFAVVVLMREEDLVTSRWMGDGKVEDTTIFLLSDYMNVNSLHKVGGNMYGLTVQSNATRDAGACNICWKRGTIAC